MSSRRKGWDWWSEVKLQVLSSYLAAFTRACSLKSPERIAYIDLFAGSLDNQRRHVAGDFRGSTRVALETSPAFTRLAFFELPAVAPALIRDIEAAHCGDDRWRVIPGDCNRTLHEGLHWLGDPYRWAPTFAFIDPRGLQAEWETVRSLSQWRHGSHKTELWILFPEPALERVLGLHGVRGESSASQLDTLFGSDRWISVHQRRQLNHLSPAETRAHFVNLYRWQLEQELDYRKTHALQFVTTSGVPVYTMVFATDHTAGDDIMTHVYNHAAVRLIPEMQAQARAAKQQQKDDAKGQTYFALDVGSSLPAGEPYSHTPVWEPLPTLDVALVLDSEPDEPELVLEDWMDEQDADD